MTRSLTRTWEYKVIDLVNMLTDIVVENYRIEFDEDDPVVGYHGGGYYIDDDGLYSTLEDWMCKLVEDIEDISDFNADTQLAEVIRRMKPQDRKEVKW